LPASHQPQGQAVGNHADYRCIGQYKSTTVPLAQAYLAADAYVRQRSTMFRIAANLLPKEVRTAAWATYAFFRTSDDMVDEQQISVEDFRAWRNQTLQPASTQTNPILAAWADVKEKYHLNPLYEQNMLDGLEMDLTCHRYETLEELEQYCYRVASAAGLLVMPVVGYEEAFMEKVKPFVVKMGIALQMTNVLRDMGEDIEVGRIYLPKEELARFGLSYADIEAQVYDERFKSLMKHLTQITRQHYKEAWPMMGLYTGKIRLGGGFGAIMYRSILDAVEDCEFDIFTHRVHFSSAKKLWLLATKWPSIAWPQTAGRFFK
jgi:phytoene synthase